VVEHFRTLCVVLPLIALCFFLPLAPQNRPQGDDSVHFENHEGMLVTKNNTAEEMFVAVHPDRL